MKKIFLYIVFCCAFFTNAQQLKRQQFSCGSISNLQGKFIIGEAFNKTYTVGNTQIGESILYQIATTQLSTDVFEKADVISIYPNPATNFLTINTKNFNDLKISMYDALGHEISIIYDNQQINLENLAQGIYFLNLFDTRNQKNQILKFIKK